MNGSRNEPYKIDHQHIDEHEREAAARSPCWQIVSSMNCVSPCARQADTLRQEAGLLHPFLKRTRDGTERVPGQHITEHVDDALAVETFDLRRRVRPGERCNRRDRDQRAVVRAHAHVHQLVDVVAPQPRELDAHVDQTGRCAYARGDRAVDRDARDIRNVRWVDAEHRALRGVDIDVQTRRTVFSTGLNVYRSRRRAQHAATFSAAPAISSSGPRERVEDRCARTITIVAGNLQLSARHEIGEVANLAESSCWCRHADCRACQRRAVRSCRRSMNPNPTVCGQRSN